MAQEQSNKAVNAAANIYRTPELWAKITFTFLCLVIYRTGAHITAPGIDVQALTDYFARQNNGLLGLFDLFVGGGLSKATLFALGIMPYISSSIFVQIAGAVVPTVDKMQKDEEGRKKLTQYTRYITVGLALVQAYGFTLFVSSLSNAVRTPGFGFTVQMMLFLTTGAMFVMWLGEQITERGLGNGASLIIFFSIVERIWPAMVNSVNNVTVGATPVLALLALAAIMVAVVAGVVAITVAARRVLIQIPQRTMARVVSAKRHGISFRCASIRRVSCRLFSRSRWSSFRELLQRSAEMPRRRKLRSISIRRVQARGCISFCWPRSFCCSRIFIRPLSSTRSIWPKI